MKPQIKCLVCLRARIAAMVSVPATQRNDWRAAALRPHNTVTTGQAFDVCCPSPELALTGAAPEAANPSH